MWSGLRSELYGSAAALLDGFVAPNQASFAGTRSLLDYRLSWWKAPSSMAQLALDLALAIKRIITEVRGMIRGRVRSCLA